MMTLAIEKISERNPFLKWAGGKRRLVPEIKKILPAKRTRLIEPFVGAGSVFLKTDYEYYILGDINADLINLFNIIKTQKMDFIRYTKKFFIKKNNTEQRYYLLRDEFNECKDTLKKSALFIYLNRHGYNGLCRYNSSGYFNVPFGRYDNPILPEACLHYFAEKAQRAEFHSTDFATLMSKANQQDVVYCDPPYINLTEKRAFTSYSDYCFDENAQRRLTEVAEKTAQRGATILISNHDTAFTRELYQNAKLHFLQVSRTINSDTNNRKKVGELLALFGNG